MSINDKDHTTILGQVVSAHKSDFSGNDTLENPLQTANHGRKMSF